MGRGVLHIFKMRQKPRFPQTNLKIKNIIGKTKISTGKPTKTEEKQNNPQKQSSDHSWDQSQERNNKNTTKNKNKITKQTIRRALLGTALKQKTSTTT